MLSPQINRHLSDLSTSPAHRRRHPAAAVATSTTVHAATTMLNHRFSPMRKERLNPGKIEARFFTSLQNICDLYELPLPPPAQDPFPHNIIQTFNGFKKIWEERAMKPQLFIAHFPGKTGSIATAKSHVRDYDLYFIPVRAVTSMMQYKKYSAVTDVILSTFAYLYQRAGVSHYTNGSIIGQCLEWIQDNINNGETEDRDFSKRLQVALDTAELRGEQLDQHISNPAQLSRWPQALDHLRPVSDWELEIKLCCTELYSLYRRFPQRNISQSCYPGLTENHNDENEYVYADDILSFIYLDKGCLMEDTLYGYVDAMLESKTADLTPAAFQFFDKPQQLEFFDFQFETFFFKMLRNLCYCLNKIE